MQMSNKRNKPAIARPGGRRISQSGLAMELVSHLSEICEERFTIGQYLRQLAEQDLVESLRPFLLAEHILSPPEGLTTAIRYEALKVADHICCCNHSCRIAESCSQVEYPQGRQLLETK